MRADRLASRTFFPHPRRTGTVVFAEMSVSIDQPHQVAFDTATNQSCCSCPFLPKPCLHVEALQLLVAREGESEFEVTETAPKWVLGLPPSSNQKPETFKPETLQPNPLERLQPGFEDLETWLLDALRRGVATAVSEDPDFFKNIASRLADASMRGLSRSIRMLGAVPSDHPDWPERTAAVLADAALALHAFRRREHLSEALLCDLEAVVGISQKKETVRAEGETLRDAWAVVGKAEEQVEEQLRQRRTWLLGAGSGRYALLLEYAFGGEAGFLPGFEPGSVLEGELVFYPSAWPHRALASETIKALPQTVENLPGFEIIEDMVRTCAAALGKQPWLQAFPAVLQHVTPFCQKKQFFIADLAGKQIPLANPESVCWSLMALSGGHPLPIFGEWNGKTFTVFSALANERLIPL